MILIIYFLIFGIKTLIILSKNKFQNPCLLNKEKPRKFISQNFKNLSIRKNNRQKINIIINLN